MNFQDRIDTDKSEAATARIISKSGKINSQTFEPRNAKQQKLLDAILIASQNPENQES
jgi:hypothetical protein